MVVGLGADFVIHLCWWVFCFFCFVSFLDLRECDGCMLPVFLAYSADVFTGNAWWHWCLEILGWVEGRKVIGVGLWILWGWHQWGKRDHSRFLATDLRMELGDSISWAVEGVWLYLQPICCPRNSGSWVRRECLLGFGSGTKSHISGSKIRRGKSVEFTRGRWISKVFCCRAGDENGALDPGAQREKRPVDSLPDFLEGVEGDACWVGDYDTAMSQGRNIKEEVVCGIHRC